MLKKMVSRITALFLVFTLLFLSIPFLGNIVSAESEYTYLELSANPNENPYVEIHDDGTAHINGSACCWTGEEYGVGNTTPGDYVLFRNVDFSDFTIDGPSNCYIMASNHGTELSSKRWVAYVDTIAPNNVFATFSVPPINGWDYKQKITSEILFCVTGVRDIYLVCEGGGSVWSMTFTDDPDTLLNEASSTLPFSTNFASDDTNWTGHIVTKETSGINYDGSLTAADFGSNYSKVNPVTSYSNMSVNGRIVLKMDALEGETVKDAVLSYTGRSITSLENDKYCYLPGIINIYIMGNTTDWELVANICDEEFAEESVDISEWTDGLESFYVMIEITRTSHMASWTCLYSLSVASSVGDLDVDFSESATEPQGLALPFKTDFSDDEWKSGVDSISDNVSVQCYTDELFGESIYCLQPDSSMEAEGVIMKFVPESGKKLEHLTLSFNGRAIGGSVLSALVSTDKQNWTEAGQINEASISDESYDNIKIFCTSFAEPVEQVYVKFVFYSTGESEIDYSALTAVSVTADQYYTVTAPVVLVGDTFVDIKPTAGFEYSVDGVNWQDDFIITDLINKATYTVYHRPKGADEAFVKYENASTTVKVNGDTYIFWPHSTHLAWLRTILMTDEDCINVAADFNADYEIDIRDLVCLKKFFAGLN